MRSIPFASRNLKELLRDPLTIIFCVGFPVILLLLFYAIQSNIPVSLFEVPTLAPGIAVFGLSFITLFAGSLLAKDRTSSFLMRLYTTPLTSFDFILGYILPLIPIAAAQSIICFAVSIPLGLPFDPNLLLALAVLLPAAFLFIGIGLLLGSLVGDKAVGGISSILINVAAWLSGIWFDVKLVGGAFETVSYLLPFAHAVDAARAAATGNYPEITPHLWWVIGYAAVILAAAIFVFGWKIKRQNG